MRMASAALAANAVPINATAANAAVNSLFSMTLSCVAPHRGRLAGVSFAPTVPAGRLNKINELRESRLHLLWHLQHPCEDDVARPPPVRLQATRTMGEPAARGFAVWRSQTSSWS